MVSYNIGHLAYLNAKRYGLSRVLFGGFFIRGHPYTMETISFAIKFWSKVAKCALLYISCQCCLHAHLPVYLCVAGRRSFRILKYGNGSAFMALK